MGFLKVTSGVLAVIAVSLLVLGGAGFSQVAADRGVQVAVVPDDEALIGYQSVADETVTDGETESLIRVTNRAPSDISVVNVSVDVRDGDGLTVHTDEDAYPENIGIGQSDEVTGTFECEERTNATLAVTVEVKGDGLSAEIYGDTRTFDLTCEPPVSEQTDVYFMGAGNAKVTESPSDPVDIKVWTHENETLQFETSTTVNVSETILPTTNASRDFTIVVIHFVEEDVTYVHPDYDHQNESLTSPPNGGSGVIVDTSPDSW